MNPFDGYRVTSPYGSRRHPVTGKQHFHTGIDLVKTHRAPILAFVAGEVVHAGDGRPGTGFGNMGNVVAVKDDKGYLHCYVHLDSVSVKVGQFVQRGQEVGKQGATGISVTGSHLHYEVRKKSSPSFGWVASETDRCFDPGQYLIDYYKSERKEEHEMSPDDANKIIRYLSAGWFTVQGNKEAEAEFNRLANELRKMSGQKVQ